jgi:hypothetical protein
MSINSHNGPTEPQPDVALRERIEKRAYHLWLAAGGIHGEHLRHWLQAEVEILKSIKPDQEARSAARKARPTVKKRSASLSNESFPIQ